LRRLAAALVELVETLRVVTCIGGCRESGSDEGGVRVGFARVHLTFAWFRYARLADARRATQPAASLLVELVETRSLVAPSPLVE